MRRTPGRKISVNGRDLYVEEPGTGQDWVVFEAGAGCGRTCWDPVLPLLAGRALLVAYDRAGSGRSGRTGEQPGIDDMASDLAGMVEAVVPGEFVLVAHSMGGLAAVYAAGTEAELAPDMHDLRASAPRPGDGSAAVPTSLRDAGIIAGFERTGRWMVGRTFRGLAVIANGEIDLRQARFIDGETTIHATAVIGNITVVVPEDADVHIGGTGILGGFDHHDEGPGTPGAPRITITGFAFCGTVYVQRRSAKAETPDPKLQRARRRLERKQRQLERKQPR